MSEKQSIAEVFIEEVYTTDELKEMSDFFIDYKGNGFCSDLTGICLRFERDDILKDKVVIKERFVTDETK